MKMISPGILCAAFAAFGSLAAGQTYAAAIAYTFTGTVSSVAQSGFGAGPASSFGTIPVGSTVTASLLFYEQQSYASTRRYYYSAFEVRIGSEVVLSGPFNNFQPGYTGSGIGSAAASFVLTDGSTQDSFDLGFSPGTGVPVSGNLGGLAVSDAILMNLKFDPSAISSTDPFGVGMDPSDFLSGTMYIPQTGYGDASTFFTPGYYRMGVTIDSFTAQVVPEPSVAGALVLSIAGGCLFSRRRRV